MNGESHGNACLYLYIRVKLTHYSNVVSSGLSVRNVTDHHINTAGRNVTGVRFLKFKFTNIVFNLCPQERIVQTFLL